MSTDFPTCTARRVWKTTTLLSVSCAPGTAQLIINGTGGVCACVLCHIPSLRFGLEWYQPSFTTTLHLGKSTHAFGSHFPCDGFEGSAVRDLSCAPPRPPPGQGQFLTLTEGRQPRNPEHPAAHGLLHEEASCFLVLLFRVLYSKFRFPLHAKPAVGPHVFSEPGRCRFFGD